jgi:hypothetical protein
LLFLAVYWMEWLSGFVVLHAGLLAFGVFAAIVAASVW